MTQLGGVTLPEALVLDLIDRRMQTVPEFVHGMRRLGLCADPEPQMVPVRGGLRADVDLFVGDPLPHGGRLRVYATMMECRDYVGPPRLYRCGLKLIVAEGAILISHQATGDWTRWVHGAVPVSYQSGSRLIFRVPRRALVLTCALEEPAPLKPVRVVTPFGRSARYEAAAHKLDQVYSPESDYGDGNVA